MKCSRWRDKVFSLKERENNREEGWVVHHLLLLREGVEPGRFGCHRRSSCRGRHKIPVVSWKLNHTLKLSLYLLAAGPKLRLLARLARLESRSPVTSLLSVVGVVMVLFTPVQRTVKARSDRLSETHRSYSVQKRYQSYYQIQRG